MIPKSDWSQFIPDLIVGILILLVGGIFTYLKSKRFNKWLNRVFNKLVGVFKYLIKYWRYMLFGGLLISLSAIIFYIYSDWMMLILLFLYFTLAIAGYRFITYKQHPKYIPISIYPGIGNDYMKKWYLDPPVGKVVLGGSLFNIPPDPIVLNTQEHIRYFAKRKDGSKEIDLIISEPINGIKSVNILINSSNSDNIYKSIKVGEIIIVFKDSSRLTTDLVLGRNIREWSIGSDRDLVRETSDNSSIKIWEGKNNEGVNAVIDCLQIPVNKASRSKDLEKIIFVHKPILEPSGTLGVHFFVFAISVEVDNR